MERLPLFVSKKEAICTSFVVLVLFVLSLSYEFYKYKKLTTYSIHATTAKVINSYQKKSKNDKSYRVLKLRSGNFTFHTTYWKPLDISRGDTVKILFYTKAVDFYSFLKGSFVRIKSISVINQAEKNFVIEYVRNQHDDALAKELYSALFFAIPVSKELRDDIVKWGIAHLVAISGFHLGILSAILFFLLKPIYTFFQDKFFPYRNRTADLALLVFVILGTYVYFIDMVPSVVRAYVMSLIGFFLFSRNIKIISFETLLFTICTILILFPHLIFSIAFWLSVSGVFYIFLFLHHFLNLNKVAIMLLLNFWVYILMIPIIHFLFDIFSFQQLLSPLISIAFAPFYVASLALHVVGWGAVMDSFLVWFFSLHVETIHFKTPSWFLLIYLALSLLAIRHKLVAVALPLAVICMFFI